MSDAVEVSHLAVGGRWLGALSVPPPRAGVSAAQVPRGARADLLPEPQKRARPVCQTVRSVDLRSDEITR